MKLTKRLMINGPHFYISFGKWECEHYRLNDMPKIGLIVGNVKLPPRTARKQKSTLRVYIPTKYKSRFNSDALYDVSIYDI